MGRDRSSRPWHGLLVSSWSKYAQLRTPTERELHDSEWSNPARISLGLRYKLCCSSKNVISHLKVSFDVLLRLFAASSSFGSTARLNLLVQLLKSIFRSVTRARTSSDCIFDCLKEIASEPWRTTARELYAGRTVKTVIGACPEVMQLLFGDYAVVK